MITPTIVIIMIIIPTIIMIIPTILIITIMITIKAAPVINAKLAGVAERQEAKSGGSCLHQLGWFLSMILFSFVGKHKLTLFFQSKTATPAKGTPRNISPTTRIVPKQ